MERDEVLEVLADIISHIIHDYNNIIGAIDGYATLLYDEVQEESAKDDINEIMDVVKKAGSIRAELALFYRKILQVKENININDVILKISELYKDKVNIRLNLSENLPSITGKIDEIELMVKELFENSLLHGGKEKIDVSIKTYIQNNYLYFDFEDNGNGIEKENIDKIFFPFFTTLKGNLHKGLGLSWVWGILQRHNGTIDAESEVGKYTKFKIKIKL